VNTFELAEWIAANRKSLRRDRHWPCTCSRPRPLVVAYIVPAALANTAFENDDCLLWMAGRQTTTQQGDRQRVRPQGFNLSALTRDGAPLPPAAAQCRQCRSGFAAVLQAGEMQLVPLDPPTRAQIRE
jgi:hypothetical protein